jgi:type IV pilus assembly protein PilQ
MRRVSLLAAIAAGVVLPLTAGSAEGRFAPPRAAAVTALSVVANAGRAEVVIGHNGTVEVQDFVLSAPRRIVIDVSPAALAFTPRVYDRVARGGILNIRVAQFRPDTVRIVVDIDGDLPYEIVRRDGTVRVQLPAPDADFEPWAIGSGATQLTARAALAQADAIAPRAQTTEPPLAPTVSTPTALTSVKPVTVPFAPQQAADRITVSFRDMNMRDVIATFAAFSGRTIVPPGGSMLNQMTVTVEVTNQPWDIALNSILEANGLAAVVAESGIIQIDSYSNLQARRATEPVVSRKLLLNYAKATELAPTIQALLSRDCGGAVDVLGGAAGGGDAAGGAAAGDVGGGAPPAAAAGAPQQQLNRAAAPAVCNPRGRVVAEVPSNSLIIYEVQSQIDSLLAYATSFDFRTPQVNISAKIIAVNRTMTERLGISYDIGSQTSFFNTLAPRVTTGQATEFQVQLGGDAFAGVANANRSFSANSALNLLYNTTLGGYALTAFLDALDQEELSDVQAQPSINTLDKREASIFVGNDIAFLLTPPTAPGAIQAAPPQISSLEAGINLVVTPSISANRMIRLTVAVEQSSLVNVTIAGPNTSRRTVANEVLIRDGETLVIAGLTQTEVTSSVSGIPFLSRLPMIGKIFSETENIERKSDLLVLITPRILDDPIPTPPPGGN